MGFILADVGAVRWLSGGGIVCGFRTTGSAFVARFDALARREAVVGKLTPFGRVGFPVRHFSASSSSRELKNGNLNNTSSVVSL